MLGLENNNNNSNHSRSRLYLVPRSGDLQKDIYSYIYENPGIRYRELIRLARTTNGVLSYYLGKLEKRGEIRVERLSNNRVTRYFIFNIPKKDSDIISYIRSKVIRKIVYFVLKNEFCTFNEIVDHIGKAPSTVSWHMKKLKEAGILDTNLGNDHFLYSIADKEMISRILLEYKESFTDRVIENYADMIDKL
jgi:predicted transcriptional regulator